MEQRKNKTESGRPAVAELFRNLKMPCRRIRRMAAERGITVVKANLGDLDGVLLGDILAVNVNNGPHRRAFTALHGLYHLTRVGRSDVVLPL